MRIVFDFENYLDVGVKRIRSLFLEVRLGVEGEPIDGTVVGLGVQYGQEIVNASVVAGLFFCHKSPDLAILARLFKLHRHPRRRLSRADVQDVGRELILSVRILGGGDQAASEQKRYYG